MTFDEWWDSHRDGLYARQQDARQVWDAAQADDTLLLHEVWEQLSKLEWVYDGDVDEWYCHFCQDRKDQGHLPDCKYADLHARLNERLG